MQDSFLGKVPHNSDWNHLSPYEKVIIMNWDWEKLKKQQQDGIGIQPQVEELFKQFKKFKLPGGYLMILHLAILLFWCSLVFMVDEYAVVVVWRVGALVLR